MQGAEANEPPASYQPKQTDRHWIFFTRESVGYAELERRLDEAVLSLTDRSLERRRKVIPRDPPLRICDLPPSSQQIAVIEEYGCEVVRALRYVNAVTVRGSPDEIERLNRLEFVDYTRPVMALPALENVYSTDSHHEDPPHENKAQTCRDNPLLYGESWVQSALINLPAAHDLGYRGRGILVGVQDAGFDNLDHRCFAYLDLVAAYDFLNGDDNVADEDDLGIGRHGTRTLSVIAGLDSGRFVGAAPDAQYVLTKTENEEWERPIEEDIWVEGLWFHDSIGVDVLSSSLSYRAWYAYEDMNGDSAVTTRAADSAAAAGMVIVNSMGNTGMSNFPYSKLGAPADGRLVVGAGGVVRDSSYWMHSSQGPTYDGRIKPDVVAMSAGVYTATNVNDSGYLPRNGTSYSCPMIAGIAALILQANPHLTPQQVLQILHETSSNAQNPDTLIGFGIVDALAAVRRAEELSVTDDPYIPRVSEFQAFPNPFNGWINIELSPSFNPCTIELFDVMGRRINLGMQAAINDMAVRLSHHNDRILSFNLSQLPASAYLIRISDDKMEIVRRVVLVR